jgi:TPP-dependent pyruvate/acetoin dehydrogenase alpha subunit
VETWKQRDPIALFTARLHEAGLLDDADQNAIEASVEEEVDGAVRFAEAGPWEPVEDLTRDVYAVTP